MQVGRTRHSRSAGFAKPKQALGLPIAEILSINKTLHKTGARFTACRMF
jgi:hypothetical protein